MYGAQTPRQARKEKIYKLVTQREGPTDWCEMEVLPLDPWFLPQSHGSYGKGTKKSLK